MPDQVLRRRHDDGDSRLVIGAEQGRTVRSDQRLSDQIVQFGIFGDSNDLVVALRKVNVSSQITDMHDRPDVRPRCFGRSVDVGNPGDCRGGMLDSRGNEGENGPSSVLHDLGQPHLPTLVGQQSTQIELLQSAGDGLARFVRLGVDADVSGENGSTIRGDQPTRAW